MVNIIPIGLKLCIIVRIKKRRVVFIFFVNVLYSFIHSKRIT